MKDKILKLYDKDNKVAYNNLLDLNIMWELII